MKRVMIVFLSVMLLFAMSFSSVLAYQADEIIVHPDSSVALVNDEEAALDVPARIVNSRIMVPVRFIAEAFDILVDWDGKTRTVFIGDEKEVVLKIGAKTAEVNGKSVELDAPAFIENGRTLVPLRFISEALGSVVSWDPDEREALINHSEQLIKARELYSTPAEGEKEVLDALDAKFGYDFAVKLADFGSAKDGRGFHLVGTKAGKEAGEFVYKTMKDIGLSPEYQSFDCVGWTYNASDIVVHGHEDMKLKITSFPYTKPTPKEGLTGELVYVGYATKEEIEGLDLTGKIALVDFDWDYNLWPVNFTYQLNLHNAAGIIYYTTNPYGQDPSGEAEFVGCWAGTEQDIPVWTLPLNQGLALAELAKNEKLTVTATSDVVLDMNSKGHNVMATIKGAKYPDEYIVINCHFDAYFHCFQDDTIAVGLMMSMAKAMVDSGFKPDHSIVFVTTDGEESGLLNTAYDWLLGSWALVQKKVKEWDGKIIDAHTLELFGHNRSVKTGFRVSDPMYLFTRALADGYNAEDILSNPLSVDNFMATASDEWCFAYMGHPTTRTIREDKSNEVYHSSRDTWADSFNYDYYLDYLRSHTSLIVRIDKMAAAPYDLSRWAQHYAEDLDGSLLDGQDLSSKVLFDALTEYTENAFRLLNLNLKIEDKYRQAKAEGQDLKAIDALLKEYNSDMRKVVKTVNQGVYYIIMEEVAPQLHFYAFQPEVYQEAIELLKAGKGAEMLDTFDIDNDDLDFATQWYSEVFEYETWLDAWGPALNPDDTDYDYTWTKGRLVKYYDFYKILMDIEEKVEKGSTDFAKEVKALEAIEKDLSVRLKKAYAEDLAMWKKANSQLPLDKAEALLDLLD